MFLDTVCICVYIHKRNAYMQRNTYLCSGGTGLIDVVVMEACGHVYYDATDKDSNSTVYKIAFLCTTRFPLRYMTSLPNEFIGKKQVSVASL